MADRDGIANKSQVRSETSLLLAATSPARRPLLILFFFSGASSLIFETIFTRLLTYTFGNTAHAVSTVLAAFLGGLALGAYVVGRWVDRRRPSLWIYGGLELLIGFYCVFVPKIFSLLTQCYVVVYHLVHAGPAALTLIRFALAALMISLPTFLMGGTFPALARYVAVARPDFETELDRLYAWNVWGAALGAIASAYLLLPTWGIRGAIGIACGVNFLIFLCVAGLASRRTSIHAQDTNAAYHPRGPTDVAVSTVSGALLLASAFLTGAVALAYEVIWTHILAFLIGNTVYAFGIMLFSFLCGLAWGAEVVSHRLRRPALWARALAGSQLFLGLAVFLSARFWDRIPDLFAMGLKRAFEVDLLSIALLVGFRMTYAGWKIYRRAAGGAIPWLQLIELGMEVLLLSVILMLDTTFLYKYEATFFMAGELLRFFCAFYLLVVPALLAGLAFPLLLNLFSHISAQVGRSVGGIYAANTAGSILGSLFAGFIMVPALGSFSALRAAATANLVLGLGLALLLAPLSLSRKLVLSTVTCSLAVLFWGSAGNWDVARLTRGSYVYFDAGWRIDQVLYFQEDIQGGLTSVVQVGPARILLSNGKFQGNNTGEVGAQIRFALMPMLFAQNFERALVIGLGTGNTLRTVSRFPFQHIDAVELVPHIVEAARLWFEDINDRVFDRDPRVKLSVADGRNFLLLSRQHYDLITIEISSIWMSGEADLYNREFYELCRARLGERGILQQWVQIHHMRPEVFLVILNTAAQVFPHVAFFLGPEQGLLVASAAPFECDYRQIETFDGDPKIQKELAALNVPSMWCLLGELMVSDASLRRTLSLLPRLTGRRADFVSSDMYPYLEYQTPKGNSVPYDTAPLNIKLMESFRPPLLPPELTVRNLPSENERNLILGYVSEARGDLGAALAYFRKAGGAGQSRARTEITRVEPGTSAKAK